MAPNIEIIRNVHTMPTKEEDDDEEEEEEDFFQNNKIKKQSTSMLCAVFHALSPSHHGFQPTMDKNEIDMRMK